MDSSEQEDRLNKAERISLRISVVQTILAVAAIFTSIVALWAALNEADAVRKQQQATAWPFLDAAFVNNNLPDQEYFAIEVRNKGLGPARVKTFFAELNGDPVDTWWQVISRAADIDTDDGQSIGISNAPILGRVVSPGEVLEVFKIDEFSYVRDADDQIIVEHVPLIRRVTNGMAEQNFNLIVCYCSVFDDCWLIDRAKGPNPEDVDTCPAQPDGAIY